VGTDYEIARTRVLGTGRPINVTHDPNGLDLAPSWGAAAIGVTMLTPAISASWIFSCGKKWPGHSWDETLYGDEHMNFMCGDGGKDTIYAFPDVDYVSGGYGNDNLYGGEGGDWLKARDPCQPCGAPDGFKDYLYGYKGYDHGLRDAKDVLNGVEAPET
jgi:Ca2+-binding RTX toxin-like protein